MVSASWLRRKSSNRSACDPRAPRWTSEVNKVRKRRSGHSSLKEALPMRRHLTPSHDKAMTEHFADGTAYPAQPRAAALPVVEPFIGPSFAANHSPALQNGK